MSALSKAERRLLANRSEASFADVRRVLEGHGWVQDRVSGSHYTFTKEGEPGIITVPVHKDRVDSIYTRAVCKRLGLGAQ